MIKDINILENFNMISGKEKMEKEPGWFLRFEAEVIRIKPDLEGLIHYTDILYYYRHYETLEVAVKAYIQSRKGR